MGIIEAHPGSFALLYKNQKDNTGKRVTIKINRIWGRPIANEIIYKILIKIQKKNKLQKAMGHSSINVSLTYLRGLEIAELKEEDMPMV